jgi:ketopantoate reductase
LKVLIVGAGVFGTVYGAHVAAPGNQVSVLRHEPRTDDVAARGMRARDVLDGERETPLRTRYKHRPVASRNGITAS